MQILQVKRFNNLRLVSGKTKNYEKAISYWVLFNNFVTLFYSGRDLSGIQIFLNCYKHARSMKISGYGPITVLTNFTFSLKLIVDLLCGYLDTKRSSSMYSRHASMSVTSGSRGGGAPGARPP